MHAGGQRFDSVILHHHPGLIQKAKQNSIVAIQCGDRKFFDILEEVNKEEQTTIETLLAIPKEGRSEQSPQPTRKSVNNINKKAFP